MFRPPFTSASVLSEISYRSEISPLHINLTVCGSTLLWWAVRLEARPRVTQEAKANRHDFPVEFIFGGPWGMKLSPVLVVPRFHLWSENVLKPELVPEPIQPLRFEYSLSPPHFKLHPPTLSSQQFPTLTGF